MWCFGTGTVGLGANCKTAPDNSLVAGFKIRVVSLSSTSKLHLLNMKQLDRSSQCARVSAPAFGDNPCRANHDDIARASARAGIRVKRALLQVVTITFKFTTCITIALLCCGRVQPVEGT